MAKRRKPDNQPAKLPEYGQLLSIMQSETASIVTDYIRQYVGPINPSTPTPGAIFINQDRVLLTQTYQELAWYDLYAEVGHDPHVAAVMDSAKLDVAGLKWNVDPYLNPGEKNASKRNEEIAAFVGDVLKNSGESNDSGGITYVFPQHLYNWMDALGMGFAVSEVIWDPRPEGVYIKNIINRTPRRFQFDAVDRSLRLRNIANPYYGDPLPEKKFVVHRASAKWDNPFGDAAYQDIYWMWLFKRTVQKFWMQHLQVGASSIPIVKHPVSADPKLKAEALEIAQMIRSGAYGRIPDNFEIIWAEAKNALQNSQGYEAFNRMVDDQITKRINGQTLTTEPSGPGGSGSYAQGKIHSLTKGARTIFRAHGLEATLNNTLVKWATDFNFGDVDGYPSFRFDLEEPSNLKDEAEIVKTLSDAGYDFDEQELSEKFNWTVTKKQQKPVKQEVPVIGQTKDELNAQVE